MARPSNSKRGPKKAPPRKKQNAATMMPKFAMGEKALPKSVSSAVAHTNKEALGLVKVPVPEVKDDYAHGKVVGWMITAGFVTEKKCKFITGTSASNTITFKVPVSVRTTGDLKATVMGEPEEAYGVWFQITPYFVEDIVMGM
jgi:hypothetical protein